MEKNNIEQLSELIKKNVKRAQKIGEEILDNAPIYSRNEVYELLDKLYEDVKHGDDDHQKWLKDKIEEFKKGV